MLLILKLPKTGYWEETEETEKGQFSHLILYFGRCYETYYVIRHIKIAW